MSPTKKVLLILSLPLLLELLVSCCSCLDTTFLSYSNCNLTVQNLDNRGANPEITQETNLVKNAFGIKISISRSESFCNNKLNSGIFIASAIAFKCDCNPEFMYNPIDSISSIKIITRNDFDATHPSGADVSE